MVWVPKARSSPFLSFSPFFLFLFPPSFSSLILTPPSKKKVGGGFGPPKRSPIHVPLLRAKIINFFREKRSSYTRMATTRLVSADIIFTSMQCLLQARARISIQSPFHSFQSSASSSIVISLPFYLPRAFDATRCAGRRSNADHVHKSYVRAKDACEMQTPRAPKPPRHIKEQRAIQSVRRGTSSSSRLTLTLLNAHELNSG